MIKATLRYTILKIRAKISYHAFLKKETILQQFIKQILKTNNLLYGTIYTEHNKAILDQFETVL